MACWYKTHNDDYIMICGTNGARGNETMEEDVV
jgi:hypothetical protein